MAETFAIAFGEMRRRGEAACYRDIEYGAAGAAQQITAFVEANTQIILSQRLIEMAPEKPFQLALREMHRLRQLAATQRILKVVFHHLNGLDDLGVGGAEAIAQILPLGVFAGSDFLVQRHFRDAARRTDAALFGDEAQHHVKRRGAAGAGPAVAVDLVNVGGDFDSRNFS